jgi:hypothetical protein
MHIARNFLMVGAAGFLLAACGPGVDAKGPSPGVSAAAPSKSVPSSLPKVVAYRSPTCGCCELWVEHMRASGFEVEMRTQNDLSAIRAEAGVPAGQGSCHTAKVGGYYVEGHVPAADVKRLLAEKPDARGLVVPGMVPGSPGMEQGNQRPPYDVLLYRKDGSTTVYARHGQ